MNKKLLLFSLTLLGTFFLRAQAPQTSCGTGAPPQQWDQWMNDQVDKFKKQNAESKSASAVHVIPVIVHVIYWNEVLNTYPNIDSNQIKSQIAILNQDFAGTGLNSGNVPAVFAGLKSNTGIQFCMAGKDKQDAPINPKGIERISAAANSWLSPSTPGLDVQNYFNTVIIPATIWPPDKYLNIWISDKPTGYALNGFATYPPGTGMQGIYGGGINVGTINNDGIWIYTKNFGNVGTLLAPNDQGRTATHELGHWLGLRHTWGDGNCLTDYCNDTPWSKQAHSGCPTFPTPIDQCGVGTSPNGEMFMNFMDKCDDNCSYMFTNDQNIRMQVALSQSSLRYQLGTHGKCATVAAPTSSAVASFTTEATQCLNQAFTPFNTSTGFPYPSYVWSSSPAASFYPNTSVANPAVTLSNPGYYTLTLVATNSLSSSTATFVVSAQSTCVAQSTCIDSLRMIKNTDTLTFYKAPQSSISACTGNSRGYLTGTNCYKDKEYAQYFPPTTYTGIPHPQVNSVIVLFDTSGTKGPNSATPVTCKLYGGSVTQGPTGLLGQVTTNLGSITATPKVSSVGYIGKSGVTPITNTKIYPYRFDFNTPVIITSPSAGFFAGIEVPNNAPFTDSINIFSSTVYNNAVDSSAWYLSSTITWRTFRYNRNAKIQLAIIPQITCGPVGIHELGNVLNANVNVVPNPNNGEFSIIFTLPKEQELTVNIYNSLGQQINTASLKNVMNNVITVDLKGQPEGVYIAEINNGFERSIKKIVVSR